MKTMNPAGTLLFGRAMLAQLAHEMDLLGVKNPVMLTNRKSRKKAAAAAAAVVPGASDGLYLSTSAPSESADFLILAGGPDLAAEYADDPRPKARIILSDEELGSVKGPAAEITVADDKFLGKKKNAPDFMRSFAAGISGGLAAHPGGITVPAAFSYSCRTGVIAGDSALDELPRLLEEAGVKRPFILTDKGIIAVGLFSIMEDVLGDMEYEVFDDIPPDSSSRVVNEISGLYNSRGCDGIIALGGGSVLDTGKGVFLNVSLGEDDLTALAGSNRIPQLGTPFIAIPTTSGTGSEVTKVAVVSDAVRHRKILYVSSNLQPDWGILDSRLTASLPPHLTSITGMDALSHAVEAYTCLGKNPISDQMAWTAIELIRDNLIPVMTDPGNIEMRRNLALASNMAGQAFSNSMVGMVHTIGHSVGAVSHAPHGSCMSVLLPTALEYNYPEIKHLLSELLPALAGEDAAAAVPDEKKAKAAIEQIRVMNRRLKELTGGRHPEGLSEILGRNGEPLVSEADFNLIAETSLGDASIIYNPVELRMNDVLEVLKDSF